MYTKAMEPGASSSDEYRVYIIDHSIFYAYPLYRIKGAVYIIEFGHICIAEGIVLWVVHPIFFYTQREFVIRKGFLYLAPSPFHK